MRRLPALLATCACLAAGCGETEEKGRSATFQQGQPVRVVADEYDFDPATAIVSAGRVRVELANEGSLAHNLELHDGDRLLGKTPTFPGGRTESVTLELEPGKYRMVCTVGDHEDLGMTGTLEAR
jgi:plastocyanin